MAVCDRLIGSILCPSRIILLMCYSLVIVGVGLIVLFVLILITETYNKEMLGMNKVSAAQLKKHVDIKYFGVQTTCQLTWG